MQILLVSTRSSPVDRALGDAARKAGWKVYALDETSVPRVSGPVAFYGGTDVAPAVADRFHLALLEPPLDLLARLPLAFRQRRVEYATFADLRRLRAPTFVKPADALNKVFDAGSYADVRAVRPAGGIDPGTPVLVAEPVDWLAEYRCFILEGKVATPGGSWPCSGVPANPRIVSLPPTAAGSSAATARPLGTRRANERFTSLPSIRTWLGDRHGPFGK